MQKMGCKKSRICFNPNNNKHNFTLKTTLKTTLTKNKNTTSS